jgi:hypothetical protein
MGRRLLAVSVILSALLIAFPNGSPVGTLRAQVAERIPSVALIPATSLTFDAEADSNSPAVWEVIEGRPTLFVFSSASWPIRQSGTMLSTLDRMGGIEFEVSPPHGVWMEAVIPDVDGTWYGYYHNELPATICGPDEKRTLPRIGAARSRDFGATWEDLGVVLQAPAGWHECDSTNRYFVGGVGDFSVILDHEAKDLYFFFSQYGNREQTQGVAVGRMAWVNRDRPAGRIALWWRGATWVPARRVRSSEGTSYAYPAGVPIFRAVDGWHDGERVDAYWGPSVHWNTYLEQYVMLLNRAQDSEWRQEGIYVSFAKDLTNPTAWSAPRRLIAGGRWYPQVIGTQFGVGTDKLAGERARFFMGGRSQYLIQFAR